MQNNTPTSLVTSELLTREIAFSQPKTLVEELNSILNDNKKFDDQYYEIIGDSVKGSEQTIKKLIQIMEKHSERAGSMEFYALVRAPSKKEKIPRVEDSILYRKKLLSTFDVIKDVIPIKKNQKDQKEQTYIENFIQRWIYRFCLHIFNLDKIEEKLIDIFKKEQNKEKEGFGDLLSCVLYLSEQHKRINKSKSMGYNADNFRRLYVVLGNLLLAYFKAGISIPFNLQKIFIEFQKNYVINYEELKNSEDKALNEEKKCWLINPETPKAFFAQFKKISTPIRKAVFLGLLVLPERKLILSNLCDMNIKGLADMYTFIGQRLTAGEMTIAQGRDWLINVYDTITEIVKEKGILENQDIPEEIRKVFGEPKSFPTPEFRKPTKRGIKIPTAAVLAVTEETTEEKPETPSEEQAMEISTATPELEDIPNLVKADNMVELKDEKGRNNIMIVQDPNVLDSIIKNWKIRGSLIFPEMVELVRVPFQIVQPSSPGIRAGRRFISFAYLIALDLDEEIVGSILEKLSEAKQLTDNFIVRLKEMYPIAREEMAPLKNLNKDARKFMDNYGNINIQIFLEKCQSLRNAFMEDYSYMESLLTYWMLVEEIFYSIAMGTSVMGNITDPKASDIEKYVTERNEEYNKAYDKALAFPEYRHLRGYFKKKYNPELQKHFVNVKIKNDLISMSMITPINLSSR